MREIAPEMTSPPYKLSRDVLLRMLGNENFRKQRTDKLMMTLKVDERDGDAYYYTLACGLAALSHENEDTLLRGATAAEIKGYIQSYNEDCRIASLKDEQVEALLDELVILNILRREERDGGRWYMFSRSSFLEMLGSEDDVIGSLMETLEKEAARA